MYPPQINKRLAEINRAVSDREPDSSGRAASFVCGVSVEIDLCIEERTGTIEEAIFRTNGCGFAVTAADLIATGVTGLKLVELDALHGLEAPEREFFGRIPPGRAHCIEMCHQALQKALANYRFKKIEGWNGDDALICSCFGVSETTIEELISSEGLASVEEVGDACNAGTGCGSCQPLVQDILDSRSLSD